MPRKIYGRTLIETMSALAILSILLTIALPNLQDMRDNNERTQAVNQMISVIHHARSSAVFGRTVVSVCPGKSNCTGDKHWHTRLLIFRDGNANGYLDLDDDLLHQVKIADEFHWQWNRNKGHLQFEADGSTRALNGTLTLCKGAIPLQQVVISLSGRTRTQPPKKGTSC